MSLSSITLALCFIAFICGQLFNAFCTSLHPVEIEYIASYRQSCPRFSFKTIIATVISALVVYDAAILFVIRHLLKDPKRTAKAVRVLEPPQRRLATFQCINAPFFLSFLSILYLWPAKPPDFALRSFPFREPASIHAC
ncbi:hypothetical protein B0H13DRAFT_2302787 [Mycena leptocephala]|nr:hypothetical protein B0H13DRAFT_2302787 [Mycena leptocephala]